MKRLEVFEREAAAIEAKMQGFVRKPPGTADTFTERKWKPMDAAKHLAISKGTLKRLTLMELAEGATDIGTLRIGPKKAHTNYTYTESALRRIHNRMMGGYYGGRPGKR